MDFFACMHSAQLGISENGALFRKRLLAIILSNFAANSKEKNNGYNVNFRRAAEKMKSTENLCEGVASFQRLSGYSRTHLARLVKSQLGCTVHEYVLKLRLEEAYRRIVYTGENFESISQCVGYESFSHFNRIFKKHYGVTPSVMRKKYGFSTV